LTNPNIIYLTVLMLLNLVLAATLYIFGVPRAQNQLMRRRSGKGYNKKYKRALEQRGPKNDLKTPSLKFVDRKSKIEWQSAYPLFKRQWRHWICGVRLFGLTHVLGVSTATGVALYLCFKNEGRCTYGSLIATALVLLTVFYLLTHVSPRLGRRFRSRSYLLSGSVTVLWLYWAHATFVLPSDRALRHLPLLAYAVFWITLLVVPGVLRVLRWHGQLHYCMNLLVLRVFGSYKRSFFLFQVLRPLWNHVGGVFVVSSPDQGFLVSTGMSRFRLCAFGVLWIFLFGAQVVVTAIFVKPQALLWPAVLLLPFVAHALLYLPLRWVVDSSFLKDESDLYTPIVRKIQKHNLMGVYGNIQAACHDDDWKLAVESFASVSDCLLIDLRGFSAKNAGTAYELGFVVNNVALENVLCIADKTTDMEAVEKVFADRWSHMARKSVNYHSNGRGLQIYKRDTIRSHDAFHIAARLMSQAAREDLLEGNGKEG
jgi:hypothetical protein